MEEQNIKGVTIEVSADAQKASKELSEMIAKASQLKQLLIECNELINSLGKTTVNNYSL